MSHLQAGQVQLPQPLLTGQILQPLTILGDSTELTPVYRCVSCIGVPKLDAVSRCGLQGLSWGHNHFRGSNPVSIALGCWCPSLLPGHTAGSMPRFIEQQDPISFSAELRLRQPGPGLLRCSVIPSQVQDFALALAELCNISVSAFLQPEWQSYNML